MSSAVSRRVKKVSVRYGCAQEMRDDTRILKSYEAGKTNSPAPKPRLTIELTERSACPSLAIFPTSIPDDRQDFRPTRYATFRRRLVELPEA